MSISFQNYNNSKATPSNSPPLLHQRNIFLFWERLTNLKFVMRYLWNNLVWMFVSGFLVMKSGPRTPTSSWGTAELQFCWGKDFSRSLVPEPLPPPGEPLSWSSAEGRTSPEVWSQNPYLLLGNRWAGVLLREGLLQKSGPRTPTSSWGTAELQFCWGKDFSRSLVPEPLPPPGEPLSWSSAEGRTSPEVWSQNPYLLLGNRWAGVLLREGLLQKSGLRTPTSSWGTAELEFCWGKDFSRSLVSESLPPPGEPLSWSSAEGRTSPEVWSQNPYLLLGNRWAAVLLREGLLQKGEDDGDQLYLYDNLGDNPLQFTHVPINWSHPWQILRFQAPTGDQLVRS